MTCFIENLTLLQWSGTEPTVPARYALCCQSLPNQPVSFNRNRQQLQYHILNAQSLANHLTCTLQRNSKFGIFRKLTNEGSKNIERLTNDGSSIRVLQRNRTNWIETKRDLLRGIGSCDENGKSQDLQGELANWTPGGLVVQFQSKSEGPRSRGPMPQFKSPQAGRILSYTGKSQPFCSIQVFN